MTPRVAILDYGCGNLASVVNAVRKVGGEPFLTTDPVHCVNERPTHYILPGQGHYGTAMETLTSQGWIDFLRGPQGDLLRPNRPILGICLGMQLMCESSEEAPGVPGLGWIPYKVERLKAQRLPHVGWNRVYWERLDCFEGDLRRAHPSGDYYFCHSYGVPADNPGSGYMEPRRGCHYGVTEIEGSEPRPPVQAHLLGNREHYFMAAIQQGNLWATQFHPEKSGKAGLEFLREFLKL
mgnify:CR=1 FL=1